MRDCVPQPRWHLLSSSDKRRQQLYPTGRIGADGKHRAGQTLSKQILRVRSTAAR